MYCETDRYLAWLDSELERQGTYHDHKERMAWTALALYVPGILVLSAAAPPDLSIVVRILATVWLIVLTAAVGLFLRMQFEMRWHSADLGSALRRVSGKLIAGLSPDSVEDKAIPDWTAGGQVWPLFIQKAVTECRTERAHFLRTIKDFFLFRWSKIEARTRTELASYVALVLTALLAGVILWRSVL